MMTVIPVTTLSQAMIVREIYNENLDSFTGNQKPLSYAGQMTWWRKVGRTDTVRLWLHYDQELLIGFSMLTRRDGFHTPLFAIAKEHQGKGYGHHFITHYLHEADGPLAGEQLASNEAIRYLNKFHGWQVIYSYGGIDYLMHKGVALDPDGFHRIHDYLNGRIDAVQYGPDAALPGRSEGGSQSGD